MRVIVAPDSFKGSIGAAGAAAAVAEGWHSARPGDQVTQLPLADGGEGTLDVLARADPASRWHRAAVTGPGGQPVQAAWLQLSSGTGVVELAAAAGLPLLTTLAPLTATSRGAGELVAGALDAGVSRIMITLGGSACTDGGTGLLAALGAVFLDGAGRQLPPGGAALRQLARIDTSALAPPPPGGVSALTDVRAPLLGPGGAAAVFGPQKGASPADVKILEEGLAVLAGLLGGDPDQPGAGAAGGCGYGLAAAWGARLLPGAEQVAAAAGLPAALAAADLIITGEGCYDETSRSGKVVGAVQALAGAAGVPVAVIAGSVAGEPPEGRTVELAALAGSREEAIARPARWLAQAGREVAEAPQP